MLIGLVIGLYLFTFNIIGLNFRFFPGDLGDGRLNLYFLEHAHQFFTGKLPSFWNAPFMYPEQNVISYSDNLLGSAPIYSLFRWMGFDIYKSYQLWFVIISAFNYISAFYFLKYVFKNNYSALFGAFIFAFSIALQSQLTHAQTFPRFAIPLAFMMAVMFGEELKTKYFFFTIFFLVFQIYCGIYLGFMLAIPIGINLLATLIIKIGGPEKKKILNIKWLLQITLFSILNIGILLPLMLPYMERKISPSFEHYEQIEGSIPTLKSHLFSQEGSLIWDFLSKTGQQLDAFFNHQIFAGGIATICFLFGILWLILQVAKSRFRLKSTISTPLVLLLTGLITFILFMRFGDLSAYIAIYFLPGFSSMRSLTRIINVELIFFAIATAAVFSSFFKQNIRFKPVIFIIAFLLLIGDNYFFGENSYKTKISTAKERTNKIDNAFAVIPYGSIVSYEPLETKSASIYFQIDAMLSSQKYGLKTINAYTATCPGDYGMYWNEPNEKSRNYWLQDKKVDFDTLYVVKASNIIEKVSLQEIQNFDLGIVKNTRLENLINHIRSDNKWMKEIKKKALQKNISVDSIIIMDANWVIDHEK